MRLRRMRKKGNDLAVRMETMPRQIRIKISKAVMINAVWTAVWMSSDMGYLHPGFYQDFSLVTGFSNVPRPSMVICTTITRLGACQPRQACRS